VLYFKSDGMTFAGTMPSVTFFKAIIEYGRALRDGGGMYIAGTSPGKLGL
jgi:hypothetical protein